MTLRKGDYGASVSELQRLLNDHGYSLTVDSKFGAKTLEAVKDFQKKSNLKVDGIVGAQTWSALGVKKDEPAKDESSDTLLGNNYFVLSMADALRLREAVNTIENILNQANWGD